MITQNIDNLHQQAGSRNVIELHGNAYRVRCTGCSRRITLEKERIGEMLGLILKYKHSRVKFMRVLSRYFPRCSCGGRFRIDIVLFGEELPEQEMARAYAYLDRCSVLLVVGSSLVVYPAAGLPIYARERGATLIEINDEKSAFSDMCKYSFIGKAGEILAEIFTRP